jgi:hypothetical protein
MPETPCAVTVPLLCWSALPVNHPERIIRAPRYDDSFRPASSPPYWADLCGAALVATAGPVNRRPPDSADRHRLRVLRFTIFNPGRAVKRSRDNKATSGQSRYLDPWGISHEHQEQGATVRRCGCARLRGGGHRRTIAGISSRKLGRGTLQPRRPSALVRFRR